MSRSLGKWKLPQPADIKEDNATPPMGGGMPPMGGGMPGMM